MLCPKCHTQNRDNARFCKVCGYSFVSATPAATDVTNTASAAGAVTATPFADNMQVSSPASVVTSADPTNTAAMPQGQDTLQPAQTGNGTTAASVDNDPVQPGQSGQPVSSATNEQPVEVVVQDAEPANAVDATQTNTDNDATQILTPEEMQAIQARKLQLTHADSSAQQGTSTQPGADIAPERSMGGTAMEGTENVVQTPPPPPAESLQPGVDIPHASPYEQEAAMPPASVTPPATDTNGVTDEHTHDAGANAEDGEASAEPPKTPASLTSAQDMPDTQDLTPGSDAAPGVQPSSTDSSSLQVGSVIGGRYEVTEVLDSDEQGAQPIGRVYRVIDHQGYQRCWNCGSTQNAEGDEFCIDCGAELLNAPYTMHEYPVDSASNGTSEAHVMSGLIVNTFVENGRTYVIEQPQEEQIAFPNGVHLLVAGDSDAGNVRRSEPNEDSILLLELQRVHESRSAPSGVFIIADGMGGHANGQGASRLIVNGIAQRILNNLIVPPLNAEQAGQEVTPMDEATLITTFKDAVQESNNELVQQNQRMKSDAGSTLTGFMIVDDHAYIINVGDSRTYMLREGTLYQLTTDHSLVGQLVAGGLIEPDDVYTHPQRSQIFRSLGDKTNVQIDDFKQQLLPGDILLSCSDGLWEMVRNPQISDILVHAEDPQAACSQLIEAANANGGEDNVSAIVVFVR